MTNYEQLIALKEALPEKVWPKNVRLIERFPHNGDMEWSFDGRYGGSIEQYCLDIVTAHAERWLKSKFPVSIESDASITLYRFHINGQTCDSGSLVAAIRFANDLAA